ncbi:MAG: hypothetical protein AABY11_02315, partial [archaeon]
MSPPKLAKTIPKITSATPTQNHPTRVKGFIPYFGLQAYFKELSGPCLFMKILFVKPIENVFRVECHSSEDMAFLSGFIHAGDVVSGETDRNIKPKQPGQKPFRLKMFLTLRVASVEVDETTPSLRVSGVIESGSPAEFVEVHSQHALVFTTFQPVTVQKAHLFPHDVARLRAREKESQKPLYLGVVLDDESAHILQVSASGLKEMGVIASHKSGKQYRSELSGKDYFSSLTEIIAASPQSQIIIAGPGFTREALLRHLSDALPKGHGKVFLSVATNELGQKGIREA